jgi:tRNA A-37 threonylcarbamoyl transferase component Bud32
VNTGIHKPNSRQSGPAIDELRKALSDQFTGAIVHLNGPISSRDNSEIFRASIETAEPIEAAVKRCLIPQTNLPDDSAANEQFLALKRVENALASGPKRFRVPSPLLHLPELATIAMSWVDGDTLTNKMLQPSVFARGRGWFEDIGAWLGNFHKAGSVRLQLVNLDERLRVVQDLRASPLADRSFSNAISILLETASPLQSIEAQISWLHGDCKTDNFILSGNLIYGIDISLNYENPVEYDLAQFLNNLDLLFSSPKYLHLFAMRSKLEKAFWRGYLSTGPTVAHLYLNWLRLGFSVSFWHTMLEGRKQSLRTWILNRMFSKLVDRLSKQIDLIH